MTEIADALDQIDARELMKNALGDEQFAELETWLTETIKDNFLRSDNQDRFSRKVTGSSLLSNQELMKDHEQENRYHWKQVSQDGSRVLFWSCGLGKQFLYNERDQTGFAGSVFELPLIDGTIARIRGPWSSSPAFVREVADPEFIGEYEPGFQDREKDQAITRNKEEQRNIVYTEIDWSNFE